MIKTLSKIALGLGLVLGVASLNRSQAAVSSHGIGGNGPGGSSAPAGPAGGDLGGTYPNPTVLNITHVTTGILAVANGGIGLASGTSGGILGYTASGVLASSGVLAINQLVLGGGAGATPATLGSLGTTTTILHGNAAGAPSFSAVSLTADVSGALPLLNGGTGTAAASANAAFNALSPMTTGGDIIYGGASGIGTRLANGTSGQVLTSSGTTVAPTWATPTTVATAVPLSGITAATGTNTIANANNTQTWNWDTLSTQSAFALNSSSITSGNILSMTASRNNADSTGNMISLTASQTSSAIVGLNISHSGTDSAARGIKINLQGASGDNRALDITNASAGSGPRGITVSMSAAAGTGFGLTVASASTAGGAQGVNIAMNGATGASTALGASNATTASNATNLDLSFTSASAAGTNAKLTHGGTGGLNLQVTSTGTGIRDQVRIDNTVTAANNSGSSVQFAANRTGTANTAIAGVAGTITDITAGAYKGALIFQTANNAAPAEQVRIDNNGSIGVGTTSPTANIATSTTKMIDIAGVTQTGLVLHSSGSAQEGSLTMTGAGFYLDVAGNATATNNALIFRTGQTNSSYTPTEAMRITSAGNVGIGTTTPGGKLHVFSGSPGAATANGDADDLIVSGAANSGMSILTPDANNSNLMFGSPTVAAGALLTWNYNTGLFSINNNKSAGQLVFLTNGGQEKMRIDGSGNVGIGVTPTSQLHTTGTVRFANFGIGTATFDANGNISSVSDERLKDISGNFSDGLDKIKLIQPIVYKWKKESGLDPINDYIGFSAQNLRSAISGAVYAKKLFIDSEGKRVELKDGNGNSVDLIQDNIKEISKDSDGKVLAIVDDKDNVIEPPVDTSESEVLSISDRAVTAALVNAVKELSAKNDALELRLKALEK